MLVLQMLVLLSGLIAAKPPKVDSLLVRIGAPKAEAGDLVVAAFTQAGLPVTDQTTAVITADLGGETGFLSGGYTSQRVVRATMIPKGADSTLVLIVGTEDLIRRGRMEKRKRIDNHAGGENGRVWQKMVLAAQALNPKSVSAEAVKR